MVSLLPVRPVRPTFRLHAVPASSSSTSVFTVRIFTFCYITEKRGSLFRLVLLQLLLLLYCCYLSFCFHSNSRFKVSTSGDLVPKLNMFPLSKQLLILTIAGLSHHLIGVSVVVTQSFPQEYRCTFTSDDVRAIVRFHYLAGLSEEETRDSLAQVFRRQTLQRTMIARILQETREGESFNCFHYSLLLLFAQLIQLNW